MPTSDAPTYLAFAGSECLATGDLHTVVASAKGRFDADPGSAVLLFDRGSGRPLDLDLRGTREEVLSRLPPTPSAADAPDSPAVRRARGRPKLGVVSKEVTLLPRHWAWLGAQRGSASAVLRRLVDDARRAGEKREAVRRAQDAAYRFMTSMAGDAPGYEAAIRALYRSDRAAFVAAVDAWPPDIRAHSMGMAAEAFEGA